MKETKKLDIAKLCSENDHTYNFDSSKNHLQDKFTFELGFLEAFHYLHKS